MAAPYVSLYASEMGTRRLADEAVTTAKIDAEAVTTAKIDDLAVTPAKVAAVAAATVESGVLVLYKSFAAGTPGSAGDITIYAAAAVPRKLRILDVRLKVVTGISTETATLRTAAAGAGTALSSALSMGTSATTVADAGTASATITTTDGLFLRLTNVGCAGEVIITVRPET